MKKYNHHMKWIYRMIFLLLVIVSCTEMDDYKQFVEGGEISYTGKIDSVIVFPGDGRVLVQGLFRSDPKVTNCRIYWNSMNDSIDVPVVRTNGTDTLRQVIHLPENLYNFQIHTFDALGNKSVPVYAVGQSYGAAYKESINNRLILRQMVDNQDKVTIVWRDIDKTLGPVATEVRYESTTGGTKTARFSIDATESILPSDYQQGTDMEYRSLYLPDTLAIDTFYTSYSPIDGDFYFKKEGWEIIDFSNQHSSGENDVRNLIDGTEATRWHSNARAGFSYPHWVTIDLGVRKTISSVSVWRTTMEVNDVRGPDNMQFLVSDDLDEWTDLGTYTFNRFIDGPQFYPLEEPVAGRYFKLFCIDGPQTYVVLGELDLYVK